MTVTEKLYQDPQIGEVAFIKSRRCSRMSIRVHPSKGVRVTMPYPVPYAMAMAFFRSRRQWVLEAVDRQKSVPVHEPVAFTAAQLKEMARSARAELVPRITELSQRYGFRFNRLFMKNNVSNWGSCSTRGNINLNIHLMRAHPLLRDYVMIHELCHLRHHDHGEAFHLLLEHLCTDNLLRILDSEPSGSYPHELSRRIASSKARFPMSSVMSAELKKIPLR